MKNKIEIIHQDKDVIIINKSSSVQTFCYEYGKQNNLLTLAEFLQKKLNCKIYPIYSIDRDASGIVVFAKSKNAIDFLRTQFENYQICKDYIILLSGVLEQESGIINDSILVSDGQSVISAKGKKAVTEFNVLEKFKTYTLVHAKSLTTAKNQVRIHFWRIGHPLAIDKEYSTTEPLLLSSLKRNYKQKPILEKPLISRLTLHLRNITLKLPGSNDKKTFTAPLPKDFEVTIKQLRKYAKNFVRSL
ncbi:MAG: hypothetical protein LBU55_02920 [Elusimicrobiota bacterium]|jgi:23S rRNA pseudouridine955/2504/2580 synthase/23S rRNA pseudouridine1911/1915/1917 synthase|nr:hypothetical protein [Elusimicrobiota bacterium]